MTAGLLGPLGGLDESYGKSTLFAPSQLQTTQPEFCPNLLFNRCSDVTLGDLDKIPAVLKHMGLKTKW